MKHRQHYQQGSNIQLDTAWNNLHFLQGSSK
jgi:hypothetical protein